MTGYLAQYPRPDHFIVHLSDTHFVAGGIGLYGGTLDSETRLRQLFTELDGSGAHPEAIIITGDLADSGDPVAYEELKAIVERIERDATTAAQCERHEQPRQH